MPRSVNRELLARVELYLEKKYIKTPHKETVQQKPADFRIGKAVAGITGRPDIRQVHTLNMPLKKIEDYMKTLEEPFNLYLLRLIDEKGKTDSEVYNKAKVDRRVFSKIRKGKGYMPSKITILTLAIAMELTLDETDNLLRKAGYALSHSQQFDVVIEFFISNRIYDFDEINDVLEYYNLPRIAEE